MSSGGALPQTLGSITATKIKELSKQRALFEKRRVEIVRAAEDAPSLRSKAQILLEGVTKLKGFPNDALDQEDLDTDSSSDENTAVADRTERATHANTRRFLLQSKYDPSVSDRSLKDWITQLEEELRFLELRHRHADFYSNLVTEWLGDFEGGVASPTSDEDGQEGISFEKVGRAEMQEQRATWESLVFTEEDVDASAIRAYLDNLFKATAPSQQALKELREEIKTFGTAFASKKTWFEVSDLDWVSDSLLKSDLLTKEKTAVLKEFMRNPAVAQEVADVLNMRLASLDHWNWPTGGIPVEMRRQLNGKYRVFMDEDLLDSLMFEYLGVKWSVTLQSAFKSFLHTPAWKFLREQISRPEMSRRSRFTGERTQRHGISSVNDHRKDTYIRDYFMTLLPSSVDEGMRSYDDDGQKPDTTEKNPLATKHSLLHLLITESLIYTSLHGQFTAIRSDFKWFGPSLAHTTILTVLEYFGVPQTWLSFFHTFLKTPITFVQDGSGAPKQVRKRGVPMSHALSSCFGEAVLFCMDFAVNQNTDGAYLYRLHDDFWFWGHEEICVKAWATMTEFTKTMGLEFNEEKTGTVRLAGKDGKCCQSELSDPDPLPKGDIRWGFLKLDPLEGRFVIDQEQVDSHISELRRQLASCKSVFSWTQAWNSYFGRFFANNFAKPAMCFGRSHIDMAISTLSRIERTLFPDSSSGVTDHLRHVIADRFGVNDLPEGFFYFPVEFGGLELLNPYIPFLAMREGIKATPQGRLQKAFLQYEVQYHAAKQRFEAGGSAEPTGTISTGVDDDSADLSLEEYTRYSETYSRPLLAAYQDLIRVPEEISVNLTPELHRHQMSLDETVAKDAQNRRVISDQWYNMSAYWQWTAELYQKEMVRTYGNLAAVSRESMPLGVIKTLKEGRFRWQS
ncbi:uncharacterized protein BO80DRAFT_153635 [Aspergillus ibericus CBS 121593]|uniref:Reverse transcriptase domain-containing protein n=1 Tax=Aspergillus ibericus CBS 121593 TaxID=1448316 RepID=A0A395GX21_9EURO|nr:hypothetical protein BO80DRAFT_153635 [Aspergillus ibericus CBS 121593]RAK98603.1 hypothetical protein BO80DRAFT_153635 [Aspergillus ibericus CBS 121593]